MPRTPDRRSGPQREDDSILFEDRGSDIDSAERGLYRKGADMYARDGTGVFNLRQGAGGTDEKAAVSSNDTTPGYLNGKLVAGSNITLTENNDGGDETLTVALDTSGGIGAATAESFSWFNDPSHPYVEFSSGTYEAGPSLIFRGTSVAGTPVAIKIVAQGENPAPKAWDFRIYDVTNDAVICEITNQQYTNKTLLDMGTLSNLSSGVAMWEMQGRKDATNGTAMQLYAMAIFY